MSAASRTAVMRVSCERAAGGLIHGSVRRVPGRRAGQKTPQLRVYGPDVIGNLRADPPGTIGKATPGGGWTNQAGAGTIGFALEWDLRSFPR